MPGLEGRGGLLWSENNRSIVRFSPLFVQMLAARARRGERGSLCSAVSSAPGGSLMENSIRSRAGMSPAEILAEPLRALRDGSEPERREPRPSPQREG